jgi:hypothetical protein
MLHFVATIVTAAVLAVMLAGAAVTGWPTLPFAIAPALLLLGLLFERYVYKPTRLEPPGPGWDRTAEKFADPRTGQTVIVYYNPRTGERRYVADTDG